MITDSMQDHTSTADSGDPTVDYDYTTTYHSGTIVKHIRVIGGRHTDKVGFAAHSHSKRNNY